MDKIISILIAMAIAFITVAISVRIRPLRNLMLDGYVPPMPIGAK